MERRQWIVLAAITGGCPYCESNRLYVNRKRLIAAEEQFRECEFERKIFSKEAFEVMEHTI